MRVGLIGRLILVGLAVAAIFGVQFLLTQRSLATVHRSTQDEQRAEQATVAAIGVEQRVFDLSVNARGYVVTRDPSYRRAWAVARRRLPAEAARLQALVPDGAAARIARAAQAYLADYSAQLVQEAQTDPARARARAATVEGLRRLESVRRQIDPFVARQNEIVARDRRHVDRAEHTAQVTAVSGAVIRLLVFVGALTYLFRAIIAPLRRLAAATEELAAGRLGARVPEHGAGEVGDLARAFNQMSQSLERGRDELESQNLDLERLANLLRAVLDATVDGILVSDVEGNVQLANRPVIELTRDLGMTYDGSVVDRLLSIEHRMRDADRYRAAMERLRLNPREATFDEFEDTATGRSFQGFTSPVVDDRGLLLGRIWTLREVTEQRELDRLKDDFVATVSHELRTPLTSMMGFLEMLVEGEAGSLTDEQKRFLAIVYRSSERLQRLVGDLLFVARLDANGLQLQFGDVAVQDVVRDCVESSGALARSRDIDLRSEVADIAHVWGDRERLAQLVSNLISNAIKFTSASGIVTVRVFADTGSAVIEVEDTGIGIPKGEQDRLFQRFFRSSTATEQAIPGTGLGLVISKAIAEGHGGGISVRSDAGAGTCFRVQLPLAEEEVAA